MVGRELCSRITSLIQDLALLVTLSDSGALPEFSEPEALQLSNGGHCVSHLGRWVWGLNEERNINDAP